MSRFAELCEPETELQLVIATAGYVKRLEEVAKKKKAAVDHDK